MISGYLRFKLLAFTSLDEGSAYYTAKVTSIAGLGSARLHLRPMYRAAQELDLSPCLLSVDTDHPLLLEELGTTDMCVLGKLNHFVDSRVAGFAMAALAVVADLKVSNVRIASVSYTHLRAHET